MNLGEECVMKNTGGKVSRTIVNKSLNQRERDHKCNS